MDCLQPLDLSMIKCTKGIMRANFQVWYSNKVKKVLQRRESGSIEVDMRATIVKELVAVWMTALYVHLCNHPEIVTNGFKEAGIVEALAGDT